LEQGEFGRPAGVDHRARRVSAQQQAPMHGGAVLDPMGVERPVLPRRPGAGSTQPGDGQAGVTGAPGEKRAQPLLDDLDRLRPVVAHRSARGRGGMASGYFGYPGSTMYSITP